jgi:hypothetical protein
MEHMVSATGVSTYLGYQFFLDRIYFFGMSIMEGQALECDKCKKKFEWTEGLMEEKGIYKRERKEFFARLEKHKAECGVTVVPMKRKWTRRNVAK